MPSKSIKTLLIFLLLFLLIFANCGGQQKYYTLSIWYYWEGSEEEALKGALSLYRRTNPNCIIKAKYIELNELFHWLSSSTESFETDKPDIVILPNDRIGEFVNIGVLMPLDYYLTNEIIKEYLPATISAVEYNGKHYGVPSLFECLALYYNKKFVPVPPKDTDEMINIAKKFIEGYEGKRYGLVFDATIIYLDVPWIYGFGGKIFDEKRMPALNSPNVAKAFEFLMKLFDMKILPNPTVIDMSGSIVASYFKDGDSAMMISGPWSINDIKASGVDFGIAPIPKVVETGLYPAPFVGVHSFSILNSSKHPKEAFNLIRHLTSPNISANFATAAGRIPANIKTYEDEKIKQNWIINAFGEQAKYGVPMPNIPEMGAVWMATTGSMISPMFKKEITVKEGIDRMQNQAIKLIRERSK